MQDKITRMTVPQVKGKTNCAKKIAPESAILEDSGLREMPDGAFIPAVTE
jgi:hypothetical protein